MDHPNPTPPDEADEPFPVLPLHGVEVSGDTAAAADSCPGPYLTPDENVPHGDFQPRLSRFGEAA